jgi:hypothetical protein
MTNRVLSAITMEFGLAVGYAATIIVTPEEIYWEQPCMPCFEFVQRELELDARDELFTVRVRDTLAACQLYLASCLESLPVMGSLTSTAEASRRRGAMGNACKKSSVVKAARGERQARAPNITSSTTRENM